MDTWEDSPVSANDLVGVRLSLIKRSKAYDKLCRPTHPSYQMERIEASS
jgi:hypothetical protein